MSSAGNICLRQVKHFETISTSESFWYSLSASPDTVVTKMYTPSLEEGGFSVAVAVAIDDGTWFVEFADLALIECSKGEEVRLGVVAIDPVLAPLCDGWIVVVDDVVVGSPFEMAGIFGPSINKSENVHFAVVVEVSVSAVFASFFERS